MADETEKTNTEEEKQESKSIDKTKLAGVGLVVLGIVVFAAMALFYPNFWDLFIKGIAFVVAIGAICLVVLGIFLGVYG